jgi:recombination protein RecA
MAKKEKIDSKASEIKLAQLKKSLGIKDDSIRLADQYVAVKDLISTGLPELDKILTPMIYEQTGKGGIPRGFVCEFFGPWAGGKSSLCMKLSASVTQAGGIVMWVDAEGSYIPEWAARHGVDNSRVWLVESGSKNGEEFLELIEKTAAKGVADLIVCDSVTALQPKQILDTELEKEARIGAGAKLMSRAIPRIIMAAKAGNTAVIFVNQIRQKIGVMWGNPETTPYGEALKFYSSLRLRLQQVGSKSERGIMLGEEQIGIRTNVRIEKSRFGGPGEAIMPIYYGDVRPHPLDLLIDASLSSRVVRSRSTKTESGEQVQIFSYGGNKFEGLEGFKAMLIDEPDITKEIMAKIKEAKIDLTSEIEAYVATIGKDITDADDEPAASGGGKGVKGESKVAASENDPGA